MLHSIFFRCASAQVNFFYLISISKMKGPYKMVNQRRFQRGKKRDGLSVKIPSAPNWANFCAV